MKLEFDFKKMEQPYSKESRFEWRNERPFTLPQYFTCMQGVPCEITTYLHQFKLVGEDEIYPHESAYKPEFIQKIKNILTKDEGNVYNSMDDFLKRLEE